MNFLDPLCPHKNLVDTVTYLYGNNYHVGFCKDCMRLLSSVEVRRPNQQNI